MKKTSLHATLLMELVKVTGEKEFVLKFAIINDHDDESSEEEEEEPEISSITSVDVAMALSKDLLLFLLDKGQEEAAQYQQKIISTLQDVKLSNKKGQSTL